MCFIMLSLLAEGASNLSEGNSWSLARGKFNKLSIFFKEEIGTQSDKFNETMIDDMENLFDKIHTSS